MIKRPMFTLIFLLTFCNFCLSQNVPIISYSENNFGQVQLEIEAQADKYYVLSAQHMPDFGYESVTSITLGIDGNMMITEPAGAFPLQNYTITEHSIANPDDIDGDGIDDITELDNMPNLAPLNFAEEVSSIDGTTSIDDAEIFANLSVIKNVPWAPFLNGQQFVKFVILDRDTDEPKVYFINSTTHSIHAAFLIEIGANLLGDDGSGEIVYNPNEILSNGAIGSYSFNFSFGEAKDFASTRRTYELLVANMPFLNNNMQHFIGDGGEALYKEQYQDDYDGSRINVVLESEVFSDVDYLPFHKAEGFGYFRQMTLNETPSSRDIVLYDVLPNSLPRVGGMITSVIQTPLSHVNLRAIQDDVPNAYIKDPLLIDSIAGLLDSYIYYRVEDDKYFIREATLDEVNDWFEKLRPTQDQIPERDLSFTEILPLDSIKFSMATSFGAKCSNVATMRNFGFPDGTIPNGFGVPFYYYDEFMKFNNFYQKVEDMINDPVFKSDLDTRIDRLKDFRREIKDAPMPQWMLDSLQAMHDAFPAGTAVRCRSSTNNEDLPGFSGAGLYTSKTQNLDEGHISKSIKQVYASMWNFRAYEERDFYRVDQYIAAMGVLCHPNYQEEKSNGVGVSIDPIYNTANTFYLNTQVGEFLITNPDPNSIPEEILLQEDSAAGYLILRESNLVPAGELVMDEVYLNQMRDYLKVIHDEFAILYDVVGAEGFGMDIEYKVTAQDQLIIKQARPWVSFWANIKATNDLGVTAIVEPQNSASLGDSELITAKINNQGLKEMHDFDISLLVNDQLIETINIIDTINPQSDSTFQFNIPQDFSTIGEYSITTIVSHPEDGYSANDTLETVVSKLYLLEGGIIATQAAAKCGNEIEVTSLITNYGASTFFDAEIEVVVNGLVIDTIFYDDVIFYLDEVELKFTITDNLQPTNNEIILNLINVNGQQDDNAVNNSASIVLDLDDDFDIVTFKVIADDNPGENSWEIYDELSNEVVASGNLPGSVIVYVKSVCIDYGSCLSLKVFDSAGNGICCNAGEGSFSLINSSGDTLITNDGNFGDEAIEYFCPNEEGCVFTADITTSNASNEDATDGMLTISTNAGFSPFQYSIDGGQTFVEENTFSDLAPGNYSIVIMDANEICSYEETVSVEFDISNDVDDISFNDIKVFPNPTNDNLIIEIDRSTNILGAIQIEIYDYLGKLVLTDSISKDKKNSKAFISLKDNAPGTYFAKCYNNTFEKFFKVIKI